MSRVLIYGLMALSLGLSGCQPAKMSSAPTTTATSTGVVKPSRIGRASPRCRRLLPERCPTSPGATTRATRQSCRRPT